MPDLDEMNLAILWMVSNKYTLSRMADKIGKNINPETGKKEEGRGISFVAYRLRQLAAKKYVVNTSPNQSAGKMLTQAGLDVLKEYKMNTREDNVIREEANGKRVRLRRIEESGSISA